MFLLIASAFAAPLNLFGGMADGGAVAMAPTVYASGSGFNPLLYGTVGVESKADLTVGAGVGSDWTGATDAGGLDTMARYALSDELVLGVHAGFSFDSPVATVGPELHWTHSFGSVDVTANAGWRAETMGNTSTVAIGVAPEVWVGDRVSLFMEIDPSVSLDPTTDSVASLMLVPGISVNVTDDGSQAMTFGVQLPAGDPSGELSVGLWYSVTVATERRSAVADAD